MRKGYAFLHKKALRFGVFFLVLLGIGSTMMVGASSLNVSMTLHSNWKAVSGSAGVYGSLAMIKIDGKVAWCLQANKAVEVGENSVISAADIGLAESQISTLSLIANFGYYEKPNEENYALTQNLIWEYLGFTDYYTSISYPTKDSQRAWKDTVMKKVNAYQKTVSFQNTTHVLNVGQTIQLLDTNGVLNGMQVVSSNGLNVSISDNSLHITGTIGAKDTSTVVIKKPVANEGVNFIVRNTNTQAVSVLNHKDLYQCTVQIKVNKYVDVNLSKIDSELGTFKPQGDASLANAEYSLFNSKDEVVTTKSLGENGNVTFEKLWANDTYYIKETKAPEGYILSDEIFHINPTELLTSGKVGTNLQLSIVAKEKVKKQAFSIIKISTEGSSGITPLLKGAEFTVKLNRDITEKGWDDAPTYDVLVTDDDGVATSKQLPYGTYTVKETKTPLEVETVRDFTVMVSHDNQTPQAYRVLNDQPFATYLKIVKVDAETNKKIVISNASFQLRDTDGQIIVQKVGGKKLDTFTTDETGSVTTPLKVKAGIYYIDEIKTPEGYIKLSEPKEVIISNQGAVLMDEDHDPVTEIIINNEKPKGKVILHKTFEEYDLELELFAKFAVYAKEDIIDPADGTLVCSKGEQLKNPDNEDGWFTMDNHGDVVIDNLPLSTGSATYRIEEVDAPKQYLLAEPLLITITQQDDRNNEYIKEIKLENKLTNVKIRKLDADTKQPLANAELQVTDEKGTVICTWISSKKAYNIKGLDRDATYTLHESKAPSGYEISEDITFEVQDKNSVTMLDQPIVKETIAVKPDTKQPMIKEKAVKTADASAIQLILVRLLTSTVGILYVFKKLIIKSCK